MRLSLLPGGFYSNSNKIYISSQIQGKAAWAAIWDCPGEWSRLGCGSRHHRCCGRSKSSWDNLESLSQGSWCPGEQCCLCCPHTQVQLRSITRPIRTCVQICRGGHYRVGENDRSECLGSFALYQVETKIMCKYRSIWGWYQIYELKCNWVLLLSTIRLILIDYYRAFLPGMIDKKAGKVVFISRW